MDTSISLMLTVCILVYQERLDTILTCYQIIEYGVVGLSVIVRHLPARNSIGNISTNIARCHQ